LKNNPRQIDKIYGDFRVLPALNCLPPSQALFVTTACFLLPTRAPLANVTTLNPLWTEQLEEQQATGKIAPEMSERGPRLCNRQPQTFSSLSGLT